MKDLFHAKNLIAACLNNQTTYLDLGNYGITNLGDLPELFECTHLETLILSNEWYNEQGRIISSQNKGSDNDIEFLTDQIVKLKNLTTFKAGGYHKKWNIKDTFFLKDLSALNSLDLSLNQISDISFLKDLTDLNYLNLRNNQISDINFLKDLTDLNYLDLRSNNISDISFLKDLPALNSLDLSSNNISDISFLKDLSALNSLYLSYNNISDISFLKDLSALNSLSLRSNNISDISFLKDLFALNSLSLSHNKISDIKPLLSLIKKGRSVSVEEYRGDIELYNNPLGNPSIEIVEQGNAAVIRYLEEQEREDEEEVQL